MAVFKDEVVVGACTSDAQAVPDPCVSDRIVNADGEVAITVLTTEASHWQLGVRTQPEPTVPPTPEPTPTPGPEPTVTPSPTPEPPATPMATTEPGATSTPVPTSTPSPDSAAIATLTPEPTAVPRSGATSSPTSTPEPTSTPAPAATDAATPSPTPTVELVPDTTDEGDERFPWWAFVAIVIGAVGGGIVIAGVYRRWGWARFLWGVDSPPATVTRKVVRAVRTMVRTARRNS